METFLLLPTAIWFEAPEQTDSTRRPNGPRRARPSWTLCHGDQGLRLEVRVEWLLPLFVSMSSAWMLRQTHNRYWGRISSTIRKSGQRGFVFAFFFFFLPVHPVSSSYRGRTTDDHNRQVCKGRRKHAAKNSSKSHMTQNSLFRCFLTNTFWVSGRLYTKKWIAWGCYTGALGAKLVQRLCWTRDLSVGTLITGLFLFLIPLSHNKLNTLNLFCQMSLRSALN